MTILQLKCFTEAAKTLSFAKAAQELYISQPAVSQHIHALEQELGVKLFIRSGRSIRLTSSGAMFQQDVADILNRLERSTQRLTQGEETQTLNLGVEKQLMIPDLHEFLAEYHRKMPNVELNLHETDLSNTKMMFTNERIDAAIVSNDMQKEFPDFCYKRICSSQVWCVVPKNHPLAGREKLSYEDLNGEHNVMLSEQFCPPGMSRVLRSVRENCQDIRVHFSDSAGLAIQLVAAGVGVALMPGYVITDRSIVTAVPFEMRWAAADSVFQYGLLYPAGHVSQKVKALIRVCHDWQKNAGN